MPPFNVTFTSPLDDTDKALMGYLSGGAAAGTGTGTAPAATAFPADPTQAPSPSPTGSSIVLFNGAVAGPAYLKDSAGAIWTLKNTAAAGSPAFGTAYINGAVVGGGGAASGINQLIVASDGNVWCILSGGQTQFFNRSTSSLYNGSMPSTAPSTGAGATTTATPTVVALPTPSGIAPGSSGKIISCGSGQALATLSAAIPTAKPGDTVKLAAGTYSDTPPSWLVPLLVDLGTATFTGVNTANLARGKGLLVPCADSIIQGGTILNVAADQTQGQLTCAIRPDAGCGYLTIKGLVAHGNQCAVGEGGIGPNVIELQNCDISNNGLKSNSGSLTHDLYVGTDCVRLTLNNVIANGAVEGHAIKYRGQELIVNGGTFASAPGKPFDLPNGGAKPFKITGATIVKNAADPDHGIMAYGEESPVLGTAGGTINGGTIIANCPNPTIIGPAGGTITASGVTINGGKVTNGGTPLNLVGF